MNLIVGLGRHLWIGRLCFLMGGFGIGGAAMGAVVMASHTLQASSPPTDWITGLGGLGVGGIIAGVVITWKRQDDIAHAKQLADLGESHAAALKARDDEHAKQLETMYARMESYANRVLQAFETNTTTVQSLALTSAHDQQDLRGEHERIEKRLEEIFKNVDDKMSMMGQGILEDRRGHSPGRGK